MRAELLTIALLCALAFAGGLYAEDLKQALHTQLTETVQQP